MTKEEKRQKKELKKRIKQEKKEIVKSNRHEIEVDKNIEREINELKKEDYNEKMAPIRAERRRLNEAPKRTILEEVGSSVSHGIGAVATIVIAIMMYLKCSEPLHFVATSVYAVSMLFMFLNSTLYHAFRWGSTVKRIWRRFDYTSIYLMIGGTFAPLQLIELPKEHGELGLTLGIWYFAIMWALIATGITFTCVFGPGRVKKINFPLYFIIGWSGVIFIPGWINSNLPLLLWILVGGIVYTLGMIPFAILRNKNGAHFIWHIFVALGALIQFIGIYICVYL